MISCFTDIEDREEIRRLAARREHGGRAALELRDLGRHVVARRVLQARVEVALGLEVEQLAHVLGRLVAERRRLDDGDLPRLAVARRVPSADACCAQSHGVPFPFVRGRCPK